MSLEREEDVEVCGDALVGRIERELRGALRRRSPQEPLLSGATRVLAPHSARIRDLLLEALDVLIKRGSFERPLYGAGIRALAEAGDRRVVQHFKRALATDQAGGLATLSAACFVNNSGISEALARAVNSRHPHLVFAAEVARVARDESNGQHVASVAPKIKESHRIALCSEVLVPLLWRSALPIGIAPALAVLRGAERHLGRWLLLGELAVRAGDPQPLAEARARSESGPASARAAWGLVAWALQGGSAAPTIRPTVELVARLSDRPSSDRDPTFLYRLAASGSVLARPMLENIAKGSGLADETAVRAGLYLAKFHGRADLRQALADVASNPRREALRGLAAAALFDIGEQDMALRQCDELSSSNKLPTLAWTGLIRLRAAGKLAGSELVSEPIFRRAQRGWIE